MVFTDFFDIFGLSSRQQLQNIVTVDRYDSKLHARCMYICGKV